MSHEDDIDRDLDALVERLPENLRKDWVVVPKWTLTQVFLVGLLMGGSIALGVVGFVQGIEALKLAWPVVLFALMAAAKFWPAWRGDRFEEQLRDARVRER